jgi:hypothetical protein
MNAPPRLSSKSIQVLKLIAEGHSYSRIVENDSCLNYHDIFFAAEEAVWLDERIGSWAEEAGRPIVNSRPTSVNAMDLAKKLHPRAYLKWSEHEEGVLKGMFSGGKGIEELARFFKRQPSAIRSRLRKLGLIKD